MSECSSKRSDPFSVIAALAAVSAAVCSLLLLSGVRPVRPVLQAEAPTIEDQLRAADPRITEWTMIPSAAAAPAAAPYPEPALPAPDLQATPPTDRSVWVPGDWEEREAMIWTPGHWEEPPRDPDPVPESWKRADGQWQDGRIVPIPSPESSVLKRYRDDDRSEYEEESTEGMKLVPLEVRKLEIEAHAPVSAESTEIVVVTTFRVTSSASATTLLLLDALKSAIEDRVKENPLTLRMYLPDDETGPEPVDEPEPIGDRTPPEPDTGESWDDDEEEEEETKPGDKKKPSFGTWPLWRQAEVRRESLCVET